MKYGKRKYKDENMKFGERKYEDENMKRKHTQYKHSYIPEWFPGKCDDNSW